MSDNGIDGIGQVGGGDRRPEESNQSQTEGVEQIERFDLDEIPEGQLQPIVPEIDSVEDERELRDLMEQIGIQGVTRTPERFRSADEIRQALEDITPGELGTLPQRPGRQAIRFPNLENLVEVIRTLAPGEEEIGAPGVEPGFPGIDLDLPEIEPGPPSIISPPDVDITVPEDEPDDTDTDRLVNRLDVLINGISDITDFLFTIITLVDDIRVGPQPSAIVGYDTIVDYGRIEFNRSGEVEDIINVTDQRTALIFITADDTNDGNIFIGDTGVSETGAFALGPGQTEMFPVDVRLAELSSVAEEANDAYTYIAFDADLGRTPR